MKKVLAELHELINDFEDKGLTAEASSLQDVFVRVAQEADEDVQEAIDHEALTEELEKVAKKFGIKLQQYEIN